MSDIVSDDEQTPFPEACLIAAEAAEWTDAPPEQVDDARRVLERLAAVYA